MSYPWEFTRNIRFGSKLVIDGYDIRKFNEKAFEFVTNNLKKYDYGEYILQLNKNSDDQFKKFIKDSNNAKREKEIYRYINNVANAHWLGKILVNVKCGYGHLDRTYYGRKVDSELFPSSYVCKIRYVKESYYYREDLNGHNMVDLKFIDDVTNRENNTNKLNKRILCGMSMATIGLLITKYMS